MQSEALSLVPAMASQLVKTQGPTLKPHLHQMSDSPTSLNVESHPNYRNDYPSPPPNKKPVRIFVSIMNNPQFIGLHVHCFKKYVIDSFELYFVIDAFDEDQNPNRKSTWKVRLELLESCLAHATENRKLGISIFCLPVPQEAHNKGNTMGHVDAACVSYVHAPYIPTYRTCRARLVRRPLAVDRSAPALPVCGPELRRPDAPHTPVCPCVTRPML